MNRDTYQNFGLRAFACPALIISFYSSAFVDPKIWTLGSRRSKCATFAITRLDQRIFDVRKLRRITITAWKNILGWGWISTNLLILSSSRTARANRYDASYFHGYDEEFEEGSWRNTCEQPAEERHRHFCYGRGIECQEYVLELG